jgi:hypothetical protein
MRSRLIIDKDGNKEWIQVEDINSCNKKAKKVNVQGEDLSINSYISKYGGIKSILDDSIHTTKASYMDHLARNNKVIKDW